MFRCGEICGLAGLLLAALATAGTAIGQDKPDAPTPKTPPSAFQTRPADDQNPLVSFDPTAPQDENPKRILGIIPNFQTRNDKPAEYEPMSVREKYVLAWHQSVDISAHFGNMFQAALQQASNGQPHYGQGWGPYAQRFGAAEADQVTSSFFIFGFLPHVLHEDPRYFRQGKGRVWYRIHYAATRTVITRTDSGNPTFNTPQVLGQLLQQGISTSYLSRAGPISKRGLPELGRQPCVHLRVQCHERVVSGFSAHCFAPAPGTSQRRTCQSANLSREPPSRTFCDTTLRNFVEAERR